MNSRDWDNSDNWGQEETSISENNKSEFLQKKRLNKEKTEVNNFLLRRSNGMNLRKISLISMSHLKFLLEI